MSKTIAFKNKYIGRLVDVTPTWGWPGQCTSLVQRFIIEELGVKAKARGNGEGWRTALINEGLGYRVERKDLRIGDIIAWPGRLGHVAICLGGDDIFEQVGTAEPIDPKVSSAKVGSIAYWDKRQGSPGLVTRLKNFDDGEVYVPPNTPEKPDEPTFKPYSYTIPAGATLYKRNGGKHSIKTTRAHTVTITEVVNGLGRFKASWLKGVSEAYVKTGASKPPVNKPIEKPKPKTVRLSGKTRLFVSSGGTATYPQVPRKTYDHYTNLNSRTVSVVDENASRVRVRIPGFSPELIWINKSELK